MDLILGESLEALMDYRGKTPKKLGADFTTDGVPVVSAQLVARGVLNLTDARYVARETHDAWMSTRTRRGDVLLTSEAPLGRVARVPSDEPLVLGQRLFGLRGRSGELDNGFLYYALQSEPVQADLIGRSTGSTVFGIRQSALRDVVIPAPAFSEQRAIAEVLGSLDDKIAANNGMADSCSRLAEAHFTALRWRSETEPSPISRFVDTQYGLTTSACEGEGPRFLRVTDINKKPWVEWDGAPACEISESDWSKYRLSAGDILVARMADPGKAAFIDSGDPDAVFASYLVRLKAHKPAQALYVYYFLRSPEYWEYAEGAMTGSVQKNMNAKVIVAADIPMPDDSDLGPFNRTVGALRASMRAMLVEGHRLAAMRDALLPQLMSGKIRVKDAEHMVGDVV